MSLGLVKWKGYEICGSLTPSACTWQLCSCILRAQMHIHLKIYLSKCMYMLTKAKADMNMNMHMFIDVYNFVLAHV